MLSLIDPHSSDARKILAGEMLLDLVDHLDAMIAFWDGGQICRFANAPYQAWFGRGRHELIGISLKELLGSLYALNLPHIEAAYRGERQVFERAIPRPDGQGVRHSLATYIPRMVNNEVSGIFVHVADVEPMKQLEIELRAAKGKAEHLATHDFLTGLPNRMLLAERAHQALERAKRSGEKVYVIAVDIDKLKTVNDEHGHLVGDTLLVEMASRIQSCMRSYDTVARLGGDEFLVLAQEITPNGGIGALASRLLESARQPYRVASKVLHPSLSIGIAEFPRHGDSLTSLMLTADRALYVAKRTGRNRFSVAD